MGCFDVRVPENSGSRKFGSGSCFFTGTAAAMRGTSVTRSLAALIVALTCADVSADCAEIRACFAVTGHVEHCSARKLDGRRVVRLELSNVTAAQAPCGFAPTREAGPMEIGQRIEDLAAYDVFYATTSASCRALADQSFVGGVQELCCDVIPHTGLCRLAAPVLSPKDAGWINPMRRD